MRGSLLLFAGEVRTMLVNWLHLGPKRARSDRESGGTAVEYAIIASLIAAVVAGVVVLIGPELLPGFQSAANGL
jgi:Flp pilus assembly pilin Flp